MGQFSTVQASIDELTPCDSSGVSEERTWRDAEDFGRYWGSHCRGADFGTAEAVQLVLETVPSQELMVGRSFRTVLPIKWDRIVTRFTDGIQSLAPFWVLRVVVSKGFSSQIMPNISRMISISTWHWQYCLLVDHRGFSCQTSKASNRNPSFFCQLEYWNGLVTGEGWPPAVDI